MAWQRLRGGPSHGDLLLRDFITSDIEAKNLQLIYQYGEGLKEVQQLIAVTCVLSYLKLLRYLTISPRLSQLTLTVKAAASDLGGFMIIFVVVFQQFNLQFLSISKL